MYVSAEQGSIGISTTCPHCRVSRQECRHVNASLRRSAANNQQLQRHNNLEAAQVYHMHKQGPLHVLKGAARIGTTTASAQRAARHCVAARAARAVPHCPDPCADTVSDSGQSVCTPDTGELSGYRQM